LVGCFSGGDGLATEGLDRVDVELCEREPVLALEAKRSETEY
jgi:hypothetical protein